VEVEVEVEADGCPVGKIPAGRKRTHSNQIVDLAEIRFLRLHQQFEEDTDSDNGASLKEED
jgi:hypothetical protein